MHKAYNLHVNAKEGILLKKQFSPWLCCAACTLLMFCTMGLSTTSFAVYQPYLIKAIGLTNTQSSMFLTVRTLSTLVSTFLVHRYLEKLGLRLGVTAAGIMTVAAFIMLGFSRGFVSCCAAAVLLGFGNGFGSIVAVSIIIHKVFEKHMGLALSICSAGTGVSMIINPPVAIWLIDRLSLRASLWIEAGFIVFVLIFVFIVLGGIALENEKVQNGVHGKNGIAELGGARFVMCFAAMMLIGTIGNTGWSHFSVLFSGIGFTDTQVAMLISLVGIALTVGKLLFGESVDLFGSKITCRTACVIMIAGQTVICLSGNGSLTLAVISMLLLGVSLPLGTICPGVFAADLSKGRDNFDAIVRQLQLGYMIGALLFGPVPGIMADRFGSYIPSYEILTLFSVIATVLVFAAYFKPHSDLS